MEASDLCKDKNKGVSIVNGVLLPCLQIIKQQSDLGVEEDQGKGCSCLYQSFCRLKYHRVEFLNNLEKFLNLLSVCQ